MEFDWVVHDGLKKLDPRTTLAETEAFQPHSSTTSELKWSIHTTRVHCSRAVFMSIVGHRSDLHLTQLGSAREGGDYSAPQTPGWIFKERGEKTDGIKVKREANRRNDMEADQVWGKTDAHGRHL